MSSQNEVKYSKGVSYYSASSVITPSNGVSGVKPDTTNFRPYILPGQAVDGDSGKVIKEKFVIATGPKRPIVTSNKWWSPAMLQNSYWIQTKVDVTHCSKPMVNEPFRVDFIDTPPNVTYPIELIPVGMRLWNQSEMYVFAGDRAIADYNFGFGAPSQPNAPFVTVGLNDVHPLINPPP